MGLFKAIFSLSTGIPMRLTTGRERSRRYQREANDLLEEQLDVMQNLAQPQTPQTPSDTRPRGKCPECLELMLVGASTCPYCHTTGVTWQTETIQEPVTTIKQQPVDYRKKVTNRFLKEVRDACYECGGTVSLFSNRTVHCSKCKEKLDPKRYAKYFP